MKTKKLIAFVLTLTMALTLCACGAKDTETAPKTVAEVQPTAVLFQIAKGGVFHGRFCLDAFSQSRK